MRAGDVEQDIANLIRIAVVCHANLDDDAAQGIAAGPVFNHTSDEFGIWNDHARAVKRFDLGCAHTHAPHPSLFALDHDRVADADRPFGQQDEAGYEIRHDGL